jgi:hypothetical protein
MRGLLVVTTVVTALIVGTLAARPVHAEGPGTTDRPALAEVVFAGAPWRRSAACWSHTMSIRVVAVQVSVLSNGEATVSVTAEQSRRSVDPASGRLLEERVLQRVACRLVLEEGCWLSASEAAQRFTCGDVPHWLRPDGAGDVYWQGKVRRFYLEWDRGTVRWPEMVEKLRVYAAYCAERCRAGCPDSALPCLLVVTSGPSRENAIWDVLQALSADRSSASSRVFTTLDTLVERLGVLGPTWRSGEGTRRISWPVGE